MRDVLAEYKGPAFCDHGPAAAAGYSRSGPTLRPPPQLRVQWKRWISIDPSTTARGSQFHGFAGSCCGFPPKTQHVRCGNFPDISRSERRKGTTIRGMIFGTHLLLYSRDPEADRAFFRDVLGLSHVDAG